MSIGEPGVNGRPGPKGKQLVHQRASLITNPVNVSCSYDPCCAFHIFPPEMPIGEPGNKGRNSSPGPKGKQLVHQRAPLITNLVNDCCPCPPS